MKLAYNFVWAPTLRNEFVFTSLRTSLSLLTSYSCPIQSFFSLFTHIYQHISPFYSVIVLLYNSKTFGQRLLGHISTFLVCPVSIDHPLSPADWVSLWRFLLLLVFMHVIERTLLTARQCRIYRYIYMECTIWMGNSGWEHTKNGSRNRSWLQSNNEFELKNHFLIAAIHHYSTLFSPLLCTIRPLRPTAMGKLMGQDLRGY